MLRRRHAPLALAAALAAPALLLRRATAFPDRPIVLVTGYAPGGSTDIAARLLQERLAAHLGGNARIVVENRPGASGVIASDWLRRQPADGHLLMVAETGSHAIAPNALVGGTRYDPVADFSHLGVIGAPPMILVVNKDLPANTAAEVVQRLRAAAPESVAYATSGVGGVLHLTTEMLAQRLGTRFVHVPYRSGGQMLQAIITGEAQFGIAALASATQQVRDGLVRGIAVTGAARFPTFPDIPTLAESGVPGFEFEIWYILVGPAGVPAPVAERVNRALVATLAEEPIRQRLLAAGHDTWRAANTPADARAFLVRELEKYRTVVERTGVRLQP